MTKAILLAEDSFDDEFFFRRILHDAGVQNPVFVVRDGYETISYLKGEGLYADREHFPLPRVLFLDLSRPHLNGQQALSWIRSEARLNKMLVVVLTNLERPKELYKVYRLGADSFLNKPFNREDLECMIRHFPGLWLRPTPRPREVHPATSKKMVLAEC